MTVLAAALVLTDSAAAQDTPPAPPPERLALQISDDCGGSDAKDALREALNARLARTDIDVGADGQAKVQLYWRRDGNGACQLELAGDRFADVSSPTVPLASAANAASIRNAASRVAWLLNARDVPEPTPEETTEPRSDEQTDSETEQPPDETDEESPEEPEQQAANQGEDDGDEEEQSTDDRETRDEETSAESGASAEPETPSFSGGTRVPFRATLVPLVSYPTGGPTDPVPAYAFNFVGRNYGLEGIEVGVLFNTERGYVDGAQFAGLGNWVTGPARGFQMAPVLNLDADVLRGMAVAGGLNISGGLEGLQLSMLPGNLSLGPTQGMQATLGINWSTGKVSGFQMGSVNVASDVEGMQGGLVNVGRQVDGLQLGLVNVAAKSAVSLGALNLNYERPAYGHVWTNEMLVVSAGLEHGSKHFHNIFRFGYRPFGRTQLVVPGLGLGGHFPANIFGTIPIYFNFELLYNLAVPADSTNISPSHWGQIRGSGGIRVGRRLALYSGFSINVLSPVATGQSRVLGTPRTVPSVDLPRGPEIWPGFFGGVRF